MLLVIDSMNKTPTISIGRDCASTYLIRMLYVHNRYHDENADHAIQVCKQNNLGLGSNLFDPSRLQVITPENPDTIVDLKTGIGWHHLFERSPSDQTILTSKIGSQLIDVKNKLNQLHNKIINYAKSFCVYLYFDNWSAEQCKNLHKAVKIYRIDDDFRFIYIANDNNQEGLWFFNKETLVLSIPFDYHISEASMNASGSRTDMLMRKLAHAWKLVGKPEAT